MKTCTKCGTEKLLAEFHDDKRTGKKRARCKSCHHAESNVWRLENLDRHNEFQRTSRLKQVLREHGLDRDTYDQWAIAADGRCAICGKPQATSKGKGRLSIDHSHETGDVRGLLCNRCNMGLGYFDDDPERFRAAAQYLENHMALRSA